MKPLLLFAVLVAVLLTSGCGHSDEDANQPLPLELVSKPFSGSPAAPSGPTHGNGASKGVASGVHSDEHGGSMTGPMTFEDGDGKLLFRLVPTSNGTELVDGSGGVIGVLTVTASQVSVAGAGRVRGDLSKLKLEDLAGHLRYTLKPRGDGGYKLKNANGQLVAKLKAKDYGFKVVDSSEAVLFKVKRRESRLVIRTADDRTSIRTRARLSALALACLGIEALDVRERFALLLRLQSLEGIR